jgi:hypothetical protein
MATKQATPKQIRDHLNHGYGNRRVRVTRDGRVTYYGSPVDTDRSHDFWHEGGAAHEYRYRFGPDGCEVEYVG